MFNEKNERVCNTKHKHKIPILYKWRETCFIETLFLNVVTAIGYFLNENRIILSRKDFMERFHLSHKSPMQYNSIISANSKYM